MATKNDVLKIMAYLAAAYPDQGQKIDPKVLELQNQVYIESLADVPPAVLLAAAKEHVKVSQWFPKISELRDWARKLDDIFFEADEHRKYHQRLLGSRSYQAQLAEAAADERAGELEGGEEGEP